jgi:exonuclease SbcC
MKNELRKRKSNQKRIKNAVKTAETLRREVRILSDRAVEARTTVVREVFNESLNKVWNDLFIRLAPEEPFLPAFELPEKGKGPVEAKLITRYRGDDRGGNPKSMLSAGNLNTAALTLFLSLHLSVKPLLPWLIIDDPVQSMDEIHIAQFAALLRTLSKQRGRQVVIAVHERPLFDYLALELSPASPGERLITVELSKDSDGKTICDVTPVIWDTERVFRANKV